MTGVLAGRYQVINPLGSGGFGQTFLARDRHLPGQPPCVVKQFKPQLNNPDSFDTAKRLFDLEAQILYKLGGHDRIPTLLAHFEQDGEFYLVQEYVEGQPLDRELVPGRRFPEDRVSALLAEILDVLAFVHQNRVIHRDLKPANLIRRGSDGRIVLIDFGAVKDVGAKMADPDGRSNLTVAIGSPGYMPGEQQASRPQFSSDIYAVGLIALQALSGLHPRSLPQTEDGEFCCAALAPQISVAPPLAAVIDRMVRYDYRERYRDAAEALRAFSPLPSSDAPTHNLSEASTVFAPRPQPDRPARSPTAPRAGISPDFKRRCRRSLLQIIGPFADFLIEDVLAERPNLTPEQLVETLVAEIPDRRQAEEFRRDIAGRGEGEQ